MAQQKAQQQQRVAHAIENGFPAVLVSQVAEHESWRKEIYRPLSYIHKWWARRLGSVFRAIIIAGCTDGQQDVARLLWKPVTFPDVVVYDPFMGSGVTIHEAVKLGCRVIGRDINPIAYTMVRTALQGYDRTEVIAAYERIAASVAPHIRTLYSCILPDHIQADVLYYFWVKVVLCPLCDHPIDLFKSQVFARHAYPKQYPAAQSLCSTCGAVNEIHYAETTTTCRQCHRTYNPQRGVLDGSRVTCPCCRASFALIDVVRRRGTPLDHRMYAKLVLDPNGQKRFLPIDADDLVRYHEAEAMLPGLWQHIPQESIQPGYNTDQVLNYNYRYWYQMFNARQLVALALLSSEIAAIPNREVRALLACLFSGMLEFNNMFASFKGVGTGAVRHMFAHHILKPELTPLEANPWGTDQSSGSFSTLFDSRILRALDYKECPFELRVVQQDGKPKGEKIYDLTRPVTARIATDFATFAAGNSVYLTHGDSAQADIADASVDLIVTDPPFFDNVHYSQLADFFYVWLRRLLPDDPAMAMATTRSLEEVQQTDARLFADRLAAVFGECYRVLKEDGLLVFTYHHSRTEGWTALYTAIRSAGFVVVKTHPVKAEMAVSVPVQQAKAPVNFDLIIVCRKETPGTMDWRRDILSVEACVAEARAIVKEFRQTSITLSTGDTKVILMGCILSHLPVTDDCVEELSALQALEEQVDTLARQALQFDS